MADGSQGTGVVFEFERAAMNGGGMPDGLSSKEQLLFLELRSLYRQCRMGVISRETGAAEKKKLIVAYEDLRKTEERQEALARHCSDLWKSVECAASDYRKARTLENADRVMEAIYGVKPPGGEGG